MNYVKVKLKAGQLAETFQYYTKMLSMHPGEEKMVTEDWYLARTHKLNLVGAEEVLVEEVVVEDEGEVLTGEAHTQTSTDEDDEEPEVTEPEVTEDDDTEPEVTEPETFLEDDPEIQMLTEEDMPEGLKKKEQKAWKAENLG